MKKQSGGRPDKKGFGKPGKFSKSKGGYGAQKKSYGDKPYGDRPKRSYSRDESSSERPRRSSGDKDASDRPKRSYGDKPFSREKRSFGDKPFKKSYGDKPYGDREKKSFGDKPRRFSDERSPDDRPRRPFGDKPFKKSYGDKPYGDRPRKSYGDKPYGDRPKKSYGDREKRPYGKSPRSEEENSSEERPERAARSSYKSGRSFTRNKAARRNEEVPGGKKTAREKPEREKPERWQVFNDAEEAQSFKDANPRPEKKQREAGPAVEGEIRLNKYIANAGICSRREADELIKVGAVEVNGKIVTEMGYKVKPGDVVHYGGELLRRESLVYVLLNKPKDYITTTDDPQERRTVMDLVKDAGRGRIVPVGRLDRNTTGLLLLTNDGELATRLTHPRYEIKKIYHVSLDKNLKPEHLEQIAEGIELEDGSVKADEIAYVGDGADRKEIGIELHSGRNRIVRRIFEHLGYDVLRLDRVYFGGLTKKDLPRGRWRYLTPNEVSMLKMVAGGYTPTKRKTYEKKRSYGKKRS